jgi:DNA-binding beta-propeller fold protein YncE
LTIDESRHRFYIADAGRGRVLVLGTDGSFIDAWGGTGTALSFFEPCGIALDSHGDVFVAEPANSRIRKLGPDGKLLAEWKAKGVLFDIAVGPDDRVYVSSADRGRVWIYDNDGTVLGQAYDSLSAARVPQARALAVPGDIVLATESSLVRFSVHLDGQRTQHLRAEATP